MLTPYQWKRQRNWRSDVRETSIEKTERGKEELIFQKKTNYYRNKQTVCEKGGATVGVSSAVCLTNEKRSRGSMGRSGRLQRCPKERETL